jgi:hypothetical protein
MFSLAINVLRSLVGSKTTAHESFDEGVKSAAEAVVSSTKAFHSVGKLMVQIGAGYGCFEYGAGKIVGAKASMGFAPVSLPIVKPVVDVAFKVLCNNPSTALGATICTGIALYPEAATDSVVNLGYTVKNAFNAAYYACKFSLTSLAEVLESVDEKLCGQDQIQYEEISDDYEMMLPEDHSVQLQGDAQLYSEDAYNCFS